MELESGFKSTEAGQIPVEWEVCGLLSVLRIASGQVDPTREPYRSMTLVAPDHIEPGTGKLLETRTAKEQQAISGKYRFEAGDIIYSKIRPYLRKAILANFDGLCSADMYPLKPASDVAGGFMLAVLLDRLFTKYAESVSVRSGMPKINRAELADFVFALPPPNEQRAIAEALGDVDALLSGLDRLIAKKRDLKQAAMQQLLTGRVRMPGFEGPWTNVKLRDICSMKSGESITSAQLHGGGEYPCYGGNGLRGHTFRFTHEGEHALIGRQGALCGNVQLVKGRFFASEHAIVVTAKSGADIFWIAFVLTEMRLNRISESSAQPGLSVGKLLNLEVSTPLCLEEQQAIATTLSDMDAEIEALEARRAKTRDLKQGMMQALLTGRIRLV